MKLAEHALRVIEEQNLLLDKIEKLDIFTRGGVFKNLKEIERNLLTRQLEVMREYSEILESRISLF